MAYWGGHQQSGGSVSLCDAPPTHPQHFLWLVLDMLLMSAGSCLLFHGAEWLGGSEPISLCILLCGSEAPGQSAGLPSCVCAGSGLQCRMGDNLLIAGWVQRLQA